VTPTRADAYDMPMGNKAIGVFNIIVGAAGLYMVGVKGAEFALFPRPVGYAICVILIVYGIYILVRRSRAS
jgi:hypothetical protein